ncbi:MAG: TlpA family protein disulfide reductase [Bacteroidia bacterium]|nr:TlpA family protein disulfide reductase [Bacteroidia bacterium]
MKFKYFVFLLMSVFIMSNCSSPASGLTIDGTVQNAKDLTAYLDYKSLDNAIQPIGNTPVGSNGKFSFNYPDGLKTGIYRVRIGAKSVDMILRGDEKNININGDINNFQTYNYEINGSELSETYRQKIAGLIKQTENKQSLDAFMKSDIDPLLAMTMSLSTAPANPANHALYNAISGKLKTAYPGQEITDQYGKFALQMEKQYKMQQSKYAVQLGQPAPDIVLPDVDGKTRKLSDLKGSIVLLDFWASWCGPCRRANPHVVETYHKYKEQGFTVFSVSLDGLDARTKSRFPEAQLDEQMKKQKQRWLDAIAKDKLEWDWHVSDLKKWDSSGAATYGVRSIPTTFLIDRDGNIAALNPRNNLEEEIKKII